MAVQILVDSASDFDMEELKEKNIICVPLTITFGENHYKDCFELSKDKFYEKLLEKKDYPMTSQPSPEDFLKHSGYEGKGRQCGRNSDVLWSERDLSECKYCKRNGKI